MDIRVVGILGAGTMGNGIAQVTAQAGYQVVMRDIESRFVEKGLATIRANLGRMVKRGLLAQDEADAALGRVQGTTDLGDFARADLIIEAVIENMTLKKQVYAELDKVSRTGVILASNTSGLSITEIASVTSRPEEVIGTHFFNPVPVMHLVEIVRGFKTSKATYDTAMQLVKNFGKTPISVNEAPAFAVNRILCPMINEAIFVLQEGIASAEDIDTGMKLGCNHPIGPLALADMIGLDVLLMVLENLYAETADSKYRPAPLLRKIVRAGCYGRKTGSGFFNYAT